METKTYLGDGVYARLENNSVVLTAENGIVAHDTIYLDDTVLDALERFIEKAKQKGLL